MKFHFSCKQQNRDLYVTAQD